MPLNILLIQSDSVGAGRVQRALATEAEPPFTVEWVTTCDEGVKRLREDRTSNGISRDVVAAILVDLTLSDSKSAETFDRVLDAAPDVPILILCDLAEEELGRDAVERGAQDYLLKSRRYERLLPKALRTIIARAAAAGKLFEVQERSRITLDSLGDAVISSDALGVVTYINAVAEQMTGWLHSEAIGRSIDVVLRIVDGTTLDPTPNPVWRAMQESLTLRLTPNCVIVRRDGSVLAIEDSVAPIHDRRGAVTGAVMVFRDVSAARAVSIRMSFLAQHDSLTELPNRTLLMDRLSQAISLAHRNRHKVAVIDLDLDRFKSINDSMGHDAGDRLLQSVAQRLRKCVRESDTVSRLGGDEFVILLSEIAHQRDALLIARKILMALGAPYSVGARELRLTASLGIVSYPADGEDATTLMKNADIAMYDAKGSGRNNYRSFQAPMNVRGAQRQSRR